jgi:plastocyanin
MKRATNRYHILLAISMIVGTISSGAAGIIEGVVKLSSPPPGSAVSARYQIKSSGPVATPEPPKAVVYVEGNFGNSTNSLPIAQLGQKGFQFVHGVLPIQKGTTVEFPNMDDDYHNVFSYSKLKRFDLGRYKKDEKPASQKFDQPGAIRLFCEIHEHMRATILVLDTPFFRPTDADGKFRIEGIPPGQYKLKAWLDEKTILEQPVDVKAGEVTQVSFEKK